VRLRTWRLSSHEDEEQDGGAGEDCGTETEGDPDLLAGQS